MNLVPSSRPAVALAALAALAACGPGEPVAELSVEPAEVVLAYPETARLEAVWNPSAPLERPTVFVHLLDSQGDLVRTFDHPFPGDWRTGEPVTDEIRLWQSALAPPLPAGDYELTMGVVEPGGRRPPLVASGREVDDGEYVVARVEVPPAPVGGPRLRLDESWEPASADTSDRQTLGMRWLRGDGALEVGELTGPLDVTLILRFPEPAEVPMALVLDEGAAAPSVTITPACGAEPAVLNGPGIHEVDLALRPAPGERACLVTVDPSFVYLDATSLRRVSVELRRVVWSPSETAPETVPPPAGDAPAAP